MRLVIDNVKIPNNIATVRVIAVLWLVLYCFRIVCNDLFCFMEYMVDLWYIADADMFLIRLFRDIALLPIFLICFILFHGRYKDLYRSLCHGLSQDA